MDPSVSGGCTCTHVRMYVCVRACVWVFEHNSMRPTMSEGSKLQESLLHEKTTVLGGMDGDVYSLACFCHPGNVNLKLVW